MLNTLQLVQTLKKKNSITEVLCYSYKKIFHSGTGVSYLCPLHFPKKWMNKEEDIIINCLATIVGNPSFSNQ